MKKNNKKARKTYKILFISETKRDCEQNVASLCGQNTKSKQFSNSRSILYLLEYM